MSIFDFRVALISLFATFLVSCGEDTVSSPTTSDTTNPQIIEKVYADFSVGDVDGVLSAMADDVVWNEAEDFPYADGNPYVGPDAIVAGVFARLGEEWEYWNLEDISLLSGGKLVVGSGHYSAKNKTTGKTIYAQFAHLWQLEDGKVVSFQQYANTANVASAMPTADTQEGQTDLMSLIQTREDEWSAAFNAGDADAIAAFYEEDAILAAPGGPRVEGRDAIKAVFASLFGVMSEMHLQADSVKAAGPNHAVEVGRATFKTMGEDGSPVAHVDNYVVAWHKGDDGVWRYTTDIFNEQ